MRISDHARVSSSNLDMGIFASCLLTFFGYQHYSLQMKGDNNAILNNWYGAKETTPKD